MKQEKLFIYGRHAVFSALSNPNRKVDRLFIIKDNVDLKKSIGLMLNKLNSDIKIKYVDSKFFDNLLNKNIKHQGVLAESYKLKLCNFTSIFEKKVFIDSKFKNGVIFDSITDANNAGAIYRSAKAFGIDFIINSTKNSIIENSALLNSACGSFDTINSFTTNNISNAIKKFISEDWWIIGLDHQANMDIHDVLNKMKKNDKYIFVLGSEGKGIRRLIKENCNFIVKIPNAPNTQSINVSNAAAIIFYETFKIKNY